MDIRQVLGAIIAAGAVALTGTAAAAPAHFSHSNREGCHAAYDLREHGLSGRGIPTATVLALLQQDAVFGTRPYKRDAHLLLHQIVSHRAWRPDDRRMVKACGKHH
jgi:hypothetical protein